MTPATVAERSAATPIRHRRTPTIDTGVDIGGYLENLLSGYEPSAILREQAQNADDACRKLGIAGYLTVKFTASTLSISNPSTLSDADWQRLAKTSSRGKADDPEQTGEFGVGFWSVLHVTDAPTITSAGRTATIDLLAGGRTALVPTKAPRSGTQFKLKLRTSPTEAGRRLGVGPVDDALLTRLETDFARQIPALLLFTHTLERIELILRDGTHIVGTRDITQQTGGVEHLRIRVEGGRSIVRQAYLRIHGQVPNPPPTRNGELAVAFPLKVGDSGHVYCTFATETATGLPFAINGHFWAAPDRRSIVQSGEKGAWNDQLFRFAGNLIGGHLGALITGPDGEFMPDRLPWFVQASGMISEVRRRVELCLRELDLRARRQALLPDRHGVLQKGRNLAILDDRVEPLLGDHVAESIARPEGADLRELYRRWGVAEWHSQQVAEWLIENAPRASVAISDAPAFMSSVSAISSLLRYCEASSLVLRGAHLAVGTDERTYPLGSSKLPKPSRALAALVDGLPLPRLHPELADTCAWRGAPETSVTWLHGALRAHAPSVVGKRAPIASTACLSSLDRAHEALAMLVKAKLDLGGIPLAIDAERMVGIFGRDVVVGLPAGPHRAVTAALLSGLGHRSLHERFDSPALANEIIHRLTPTFLLGLMNRRVVGDPINEAVALLVTIFAMAEDGTSPEEFAAFKSAAIWPSADGTTRPLDQLFLPVEDRPIRSEQRHRVVDPRLCSGMDSRTKTCRRALEDILGVLSLDATQDAVEACLSPPKDLEELRVLLGDLVDCRKRLKPKQRLRLKGAAFVPCLDGKLRQPSHTLAPLRPLPLSLGERTVIPTVADDRRLLELLHELGMPTAPSIADLIGLAQNVAALPVRNDDDANTLWNFLQFSHDLYSAQELQRLGSIAWAPASPSGKRARPCDLADPGLIYAQLLYETPAGVASLPTLLREGMGLRGSLSTEDFVELAKTAEQREVPLSHQYFYDLNRRAANEADARKIAALRSCAFFPVGRKLRRPAELIAVDRAEVWGHLRTAIAVDSVERLPHLFRSWGVDSDSLLRWTEHADVLGELAGRDELTDEDRALALRRIESIGLAVTRGELTPQDLLNRRIVLTSLGVVRPEGALWPDMPQSIVAELAPHLALAKYTPKSEPLLRRLAIPMLSETISLHPFPKDPVPDNGWRPTLRRHADNIRRFLQAVGANLDDDWMDQWPPPVERVRDLSIQAHRDQAVVAEWPASSYLGSTRTGLKLYVRGASTSTRDVVDAVAALFGFEPGRKTLLVSVLDAQTAADGAEALNYDDIPPLDAGVVGWSRADVVELDDMPDAGSLDLDVEQPPVTSAREAPLAPVATPVSFEPARASDMGEQDDRDPSYDEAISPTTAPVLEVAPPRLIAPRVATEWDELEGTYHVEERWEPDVEERDVGADDPRNAENPLLRRCVLSFYDVDNGFLPIGAVEAHRLASGPLRSVHLFGELRDASLVGKHHLRIFGGRAVFQEQQVVPGTVVRVQPGAMGVIELELHEEPHPVEDVWLLEVTDEGKLVREHCDAVEVRWETDGPVYRCERRWEDIEALRAEANASSLDLVIRVFDVFGDEGLTAVEVWNLVALYRLFSISTIRQILSRQSGLFELTGDRWYKRGETILKFKGSTGVSSRPPVAGLPNIEPAIALVTKIRRAAKALATMLIEVDEPDLWNDVAAVLGLQIVAGRSSHECFNATRNYLAAPDELLLASLRRELARHPDLANVIVTAISQAEGVELTNGLSLLEVVRELGVPGAVARADTLIDRVVRPTRLGADGLTPAERVEQAILQQAQGGLRDDGAASEIVRALKELRACHAYDEPHSVLDQLLRIERILRRGASGITGLPSVEAAQSELLAALDAEIGRTDFHSDTGRQQLLLTLRLLQGDITSVLDAAKELGNYLRASDATKADAGAVFRTGLAFAQARHHTSPTVRYMAASPERNVVAPASLETQRFLEDWAALAGVRAGST